MLETSQLVSGTIRIRQSRFYYLLYRKRRSAGGNQSTCLTSHTRSEGGSHDACLSSRGGWRGDQPLSWSLALLVGLDLTEGQTMGPKTVISRKEHLAVSQPQVIETSHTGPAAECHQRELLTPAPADPGMLTPSLEGGEQGGRGSDI